MLLALDVGNTHTVVGFFSNEKMIHHWRVSTHPLVTGDEFRVKLELILSSDGYQLRDVSNIVVSSVVPGLTRVLRSAFPGQKLVIIDHTWPFSFHIKTESPHQVGADRLVNAEAAVRDHGFPCIVVDSGTATTICAIAKNAKGEPEYLGGAIFAGIELSMQALAKNAAQLFTVELTPPERVIGNNTHSALRSGLLFGYASMIDGMIKKFKVELGQNDLPVICTGGIGQLMKNLTQEITYFDSDLTLKGIAYLYDSFRKR